MAIRAVVLCLCILGNLSPVQSEGSVDQAAGVKHSAMRKERGAAKILEDSTGTPREESADSQEESQDDDAPDSKEVPSADESNSELQEAASPDGAADDAAGEDDTEDDSLLEEEGSSDEEDEEGGDEGDEVDEEEGEDEADAEEEDSDVHYVPEKSMLELEKMHVHQNATKDAILALISDEHEETLADDEVMLPVRLEGHTEHFPKALDTMEPAAFLEKVMKGRNEIELKSVSLAALRQESEEDDGESDGEDVEDGEGLDEEDVEGDDTQEDDDEEESTEDLTETPAETAILDKEEADAASGKKSKAATA